MRASIGLVLLLAACDGLHTVGSSAQADQCCYSGIAGSKVATCADPTSCSCAPELCGAGGACKLAADCPAPAIPCRFCPDGTTLCPTADCVAGQCTAVLPPACPGTACKDPSQCPTPSACVKCADGSAACYVATCEGGVCGALAPTCPPSSCDPTATSTTAACPPVPSSCISCADGTTQCATNSCVNGQCQVVYPSCPSAQCKLDTDCPQPTSPCTLCPDGSTSCPSAICVNGACKLSQTPCPTAPQCTVSTDCKPPTTCPSTCCMALCTADHRCQTVLCM